MEYQFLIALNLRVSVFKTRLAESILTPLVLVIHVIFTTDFSDYTDFLKIAKGIAQIGSPGEASASAARMGESFHDSNL